MEVKEAVQRLRNTPSSSQRLTKSDFEYLTDTANQRTKIAEYSVDQPIAFVERGIRLVLTVHESFTTDGSGGNTETFNLSADLIETVNTSDLVVFADGDRVRPDSVDADADSFDYTDSGTASDLDVFYVARDPVQIEVEKSSPSAQGNVTEVVFDDVTSMLHERDQNQDPPVPDFDTALGPVVPKDWTVDIYADGPVAQAFEANGVEAVNAVLSMPIRRSAESIEGLSNAVKQDIIG